MTIRWIEKNVCVHCPKSAAEVEAVWRRRRSFPFDYILLHNNNKEKTTLGCKSIGARCGLGRSD
jgi:hypothetical protein